MEKSLGYPASAVRWNVNAERVDYAETVFHAIIATNGFSVLAEQELVDEREEMRPESVPGQCILWTEHEYSRSLVARWPDSDATIVIGQSAGFANVWVASNDLAAARRIIAKIDESLPRKAPEGNTVLPVTFWHLGNEGAETTVRQIELAKWINIATNYTGDTRRRLAPLMEGFKPAKSDGRLLLWHGEPGTGKTFAIRALAWAWKEWCRFEYVIDPEQLFDRGSYLTEVLLNRGSDHSMQPSDRGKWRLLILEDSGEMIGADAKSQVGQGLSRLLNVSDGILGQGTKMMILVTTNEDLGKLNRAIRRPGRCLSEIEFQRFDPEEAGAWLRSAGCDSLADGPRTLSELYAIRRGRSLAPASRRIGFGPPTLDIGNGVQGGSVCRVTPAGSLADAVSSRSFTSGNSIE
jgi:hypothetical protein